MSGCELGKAQNSPRLLIGRSRKCTFIRQLIYGYHSSFSIPNSLDLAGGEGFGNRIGLNGIYLPFPHARALQQCLCLDEVVGNVSLNRIVKAQIEAQNSPVPTNIEHICSFFELVKTWTMRGRAQKMESLRRCAGYETRKSVRRGGSDQTPRGGVEPGGLCRGDGHAGNRHQPARTGRGVAVTGHGCSDCSGISDHALWRCWRRPSRSNGTRPTLSHHRYRTRNKANWDARASR